MDRFKEAMMGGMAGLWGPDWMGDGAKELGR